MLENAKRMFSARTIIFIVLLIIALFSYFVVSEIVSNPGYYEAITKSLDEKKVTVMKLAATAAATSTAISLLPGDVGEPIANELAKLSTYFIIILCAILLEKTLISIVGYLSFTCIIPFACFLGAASLFTKIDGLKELAIKMAVKLAIFGIVLFVAIPVSIHISDLIYSSHQASLEQTVETVIQNEQYIDEKKEELSKEDKGWMNKTLEYVSNIASKVGKGVSEMFKRGEDSLGALLDAIAVMLITSCVIPIVVILIFAWIIKILFGMDFKLLNLKKSIRE